MRYYYVVFEKRQNYYGGKRLNKAGKYMYKLSDILLYPRELHGRLTDRKPSLYAGIIFVGIADLFLPEFVETCKALFSGKTSNQVIVNLLISIGVVLLLGIIDVVVFSLPLFDFFKYIKKKEGQPHNASAVKVMKVYVSSYFILLPVQLLLHYTVFREFNENSSLLLQNLFALYFFAVIIWSTAIVTRGINTLFNLNVILRKLSFIIVFTWNMLIMVAFSYQIFPWIMKIFTIAGIKLPV